VFVYMVLTGMYNDVHCLPSIQCLQRTVMNEQKQLSISNRHIRVPSRRAFNFAQVPFRCVLVMPSNSVIKAEF